MCQEVEFNPLISAAIRSHNLAELKRIITEQPQQIRAFTPFAGGTWLHFAAREGDVDAVEFFLSLGLNVNVGDARDGRAPICDAGLGGHASVVELLLNAGAIMDTSQSVRNPLFSAIIGKSELAVKLLLSHGIDCLVRYDGPSMKKMDAVAFALERGAVSIAEQIALFIAKADKEFASKILETGMRTAKLNNS